MPAAALLTTRHTCHATGLHEIALLDSSFQTADDVMAHMRRILDETLPGATLRLVIDNTRTGMLPLPYVTQGVQALRRDYPLHRRLRVAILYESGYVVGLVETFLRLLRLDSTNRWRFFPAESRAAALDWLMAEPDPTFDGF